MKGTREGRRRVRELINRDHYTGEDRHRISPHVIYMQCECPRCIKQKQEWRFLHERN